MGRQGGVWEVKKIFRSGHSLGGTASHESAPVQDETNQSQSFLWLL